MNPCPCGDLDGYLAGWLSADERARFEAHLAGCPACRRGVQQQRRIDRLLARAATCAEPIPPALIGRIKGQIRSLRRRRVVRWSFGLSAAVAVLLAVGLWIATQDNRVPPEPSSFVQNLVKAEAGQPQATPPAPLASEPEPPVRVSLANASDGIVVPVVTSNPNVSIVWVYPTVRPAQRAGKPNDRAP